MLEPVLFGEIKRNQGDSMDVLLDQILISCKNPDIPGWEKFSKGKNKITYKHFVFIIRGTKIAFLFYDIKKREIPENVMYKGLVPVTYLMANNIKSNIDIIECDYPRTISDLNTLELTSSKKIEYPFIWD